MVESCTYGLKATSRCLTSRSRQGRGFSSSTGSLAFSIEAQDSRWCRRFTRVTSPIHLDDYSFNVIQRCPSTGLAHFTTGRTYSSNVATPMNPLPSDACSLDHGVHAPYELRAIPVPKSSLSKDHGTDVDKEAQSITGGRGADCATCLQIMSRRTLPRSPECIAGTGTHCGDRNTLVGFC